MSIDQDRFNCPQCGAGFRWKADLAGRRVKCKCNAVIEVPRQPAGAPGEDIEVDSAVAVAVAAPAAIESTATAACPSCGASVKASAVICISCGTNIKEGKKLDTLVGKAVKTGSGGKRDHRVYRGTPDGFMGKFRRGWEFAKISYGILWDYKNLLVFPLVSGVAAILVFLSFVLPLWGTGTLEQLSTAMDGDGGNNVPPIVYVITFLYYLASFFVILFFNTALTACAMKVCNGETPTVRYGFEIAMKRLPQIFAWAIVSAIVGVILKAIENANQKIGKFISAVLGSAWTVLTFFVVPVLCIEGVGPKEAFTRSVATLRQAWGEGVIGNFSLGLFAFLIALPIYALFLILGYMAIDGGNHVFLAIVITLFIVVAILHAIISSAADVVFKALLYNYATGRSVPENVDDELFAAAFAQTPE
jgi:hypothetical protein